MMWIICAAVCALAIAIGTGIVLKKKNSSLRVVGVLGCLFLATYVIYLPLFLDSYDVLPGLVGNLVHVLQVITVDADIMDSYDAVNSGIGNYLFAKIYMVLVGFLHIAMPTVSALTAVTVLFRYFSSVRLLFANISKKPLFVFSEINERSLQLAKSLEKTKCHIVFAAGSEKSSGFSNDVGRGFVFKEKSISELKIKGHRDSEIYFFCISDDEDLSLSYSLRLIEKFSGVKEEEQIHIHIYQFSKYRDYSVFVDSSDKGDLDVQCVNEYEMLIYNLLNKYPLLKCKGSQIHVLLYGLSEINIIALKAVAWCGQLSGFSLRISVVGVDIGNQVADLRLSVPGLFTERYCINFYNCQNKKEVFDSISKNCSDANYIIVSEKSDNETMNIGIRLRRLFYCIDKEFSNCPPIFCYIKDTAKFKIVENLATAESNPKRKVQYNLTPFGNISEVYSYKSLVDSELEKIAKNVHLAYEEIFSDGAIDVKAAIKRYNIFEVNKRSNRANALHIRYKLNMLGLDYTDDDKAVEVQMSEYFTDECLKKFSVLEHNRWMAFLETEGWSCSSREDVRKYQKSDLSRGRHSCPILKLHPYICEYEKLKDLSLDLEGKDTTVYDKELVLRIPDILGDKWNVAGKKYKIIKIS